jgi:methionyl-tRNA formyltransferase
MQMEAGLDTGPVLVREATDIATDETTGALHDRLSAMGASLVVHALAQLSELTPQVQPDEGVTYAAKIDKAEARVDWTQSAVAVDRLIRGLSPFPGAWCEISGERIKLLGSRVVTEDGQPGQVLDGFIIACGDSAVEITHAQRSGKKAMPVAEVLKGLKLGPHID